MKRVLAWWVPLALLFVCGCATETPQQPKNVGRTGLEQERALRMRNESYLLFGSANPEDWERGRKQLRLLGEPLVSKETLALVDRSESANPSEAAEARQSIYRRGQVPQILAGLRGGNYDDWRAVKYEVLKFGGQGKEALILTCLLKFQGDSADEIAMARRMLVELGAGTAPYLAQCFQVSSGALNEATPPTGSPEAWMPRSTSLLRVHCATTLALLGAEGQKVLAQLVASPDEGNRFAVAKGVAAGDRAYAFNVLVGYLQKDASWRVRAAAAEGLGVLKDRRAVGPLTQALQDSDTFVRHKAGDALTQLRDERSVDALLETFAAAPKPKMPTQAECEKLALLLDQVEKEQKIQRGVAWTFSEADYDAMDKRIQLAQALGRTNDGLALEAVFKALCELPPLHPKVLYHPSPGQPPVMVSPLYRAYDNALKSLLGMKGDLRVRTAHEWRVLLEKVLK